MRKSVIQNWVSLVARISALLGLISCAADEGQQLSDLELTEQQLEGPSITEQPVTSQTVTQSGLPVQIKGNSGSVIQDAVLMASGNSFMEGTTIEIAEADNLQEGDQEILKSLLPSQDDSQYDLSPAGPAVQVFVYPAQELQEPLEIHLPLSKSSSSSFGLVATTSQTSYLIYYKPIDNSVRLLNDVDVTVMQDKVSIKTKHLGVFQVWSLKSKAKVRSSEAVEKEIVTIIEEIKEIPTSTAEEEQSKDKEEAVVIIDELQEKVYDEEPDEELELLKKFAESLEEDKETANKLIDIEVNQEPTAPAELAPEEKTNTDFIKVAKNEDGTKSTI